MTDFYENEKAKMRQCIRIIQQFRSPSDDLRGEWPSGLYSLRQVTEEVKLGRVRSDFGWMTSEA